MNGWDIDVHDTDESYTHRDVASGRVALKVCATVSEWVEHWTKELVVDGDPDVENDWIDVVDGGYWVDRPFSAEYDETIRVIAVGDDAMHTVSVDGLEVLDDDDWCAGCGQVMCRAH